MYSIHVAKRKTKIEWYLNAGSGVGLKKLLISLQEDLGQVQTQLLCV